VLEKVKPEMTKAKMPKEQFFLDIGDVLVGFIKDREAELTMVNDGRMWYGSQGNG
jgi:hypothetical protein